MGQLTFDSAERTRLCDLLEALGPDAPTLLRPWTTHDLAAHLYLRENDPLAGPGLVLSGAWGRLAEAHRQAALRRGYVELVAAVRSGPRGIFRLGWMRRVPNLNELFVHHEDVRRANGGRSRELETGFHQALWANARGAAWYLTRRLPAVGLVLRNSVTGETVRVRRGAPAITIVGEPGELLLYLFGRGQVAEVELDGPTSGIRVLQSTKIGL